MSLEEKFSYIIVSLNDNESIKDGKSSEFYTELNPQNQSDKEKINNYYQNSHKKGFKYHILFEQDRLTEFFEKSHSTLSMYIVSNNSLEHTAKVSENLLKAIISYCMKDPNLDILTLFKKSLDWKDKTVQLKILNRIGSRYDESWTDLIQVYATLFYCFNDEHLELLIQFHEKYKYPFETSFYSDDIQNNNYYMLKFYLENILQKKERILSQSSFIHYLGYGKYEYIDLLLEHFKVDMKDIKVIDVIKHVDYIMELYRLNKIECDKEFIDELSEEVRKMKIEEIKDPIIIYFTKDLCDEKTLSQYGIKLDINKQFDLTKISNYFDFRINHDYYDYFMFDQEKLIEFGFKEKYNDFNLLLPLTDCDPLRCLNKFSDKFLQFWINYRLSRTHNVNVNTETNIIHIFINSLCWKDTDAKINIVNRVFEKYNIDIDTLYNIRRNSYMQIMECRNDGNLEILIHFHQKFKEYKKSSVNVTYHSIDANLPNYISVVVNNNYKMLKYFFENVLDVDTMHIMKYNIFTLLISFNKYEYTDLITERFKVKYEEKSFDVGLLRHADYVIELYKSNKIECKKEFFEEFLEEAKKADMKEVIEKLEKLLN